MDGDEDLVFLAPDSVEDSQAPARTGRPGQRWLWLLLAAVLVGAVLVQANRHPSAPVAAPSSRSTPPSAAFTRITPAPRATNTAPVTVTQLQRPLLGQTGNWTLFGRGERTLIRIDLARNEITRTEVPSLQSGAPVYFVPAAGEVIIRSLDFVPSYVVPDGRPARPVPPGFGPGGPIFPGPDAGHVWVDTGDNEHPAVTLTALDGSATGTVLRLPAGSSPLEAVGAGTGQLLVTSEDGLYLVQLERVRHISTGSLLATGPTGWLVAECVQPQHCRQVLIDRATGQRRLLGPESANGGYRAPWGQIAPDGGTAAIFDVGSDGHNTVELVDLHTGSIRPTGLDLYETTNDGTIRWSPDSRWLFAIDVNGNLTVLDQATRQVRSLPGPLPPLTQLAVRVDG